MGQKVNPHGLRVGVIKNWSSRWFARDDQFGDTLVEDYKLRKMLKTKLYGAGVESIEIERDAQRVRIFISCAKPGIVIGKSGSEIEKLKVECQKFLGKPVIINIVEVKKPDLNAQLVAENNHNMDVNNLYVAECYACPGPILKRMRPSAHGRGFRILKRTSHVTLVLKEKE